MGTTMVLSIRQLAGRWRIVIVVLLAGMPVGIATLVSVLSSEGRVGGDGVDVLFDGLIVAAILPIVTMALATAAFGNELEDRTLSYLMLKPVSRWLIALPKLLATLVLAAPLLVVSSVVTALIGLEATRAAVAVGVALFAGTVAYAAIFTWAGLFTRSALAFALLYVFVWEGLIATFLEGVRYMSVRGYTLAIIHGIDDKSFATFEDTAIELPAAIVGAAAVTVVFFGLTVYQLRRMDVP